MPFQLYIICTQAIRKNGIYKMKLVLLGLNEINFDYVEKYIASGISLQILKVIRSKNFKNL